MSRYKVLFTLTILLYWLAGFSVAVQAAPKLAYTLSFPEPQTHYAEVEVALSGFKANYIDLKMPVWAPGSYLVREFPKNVEGFRATGEGGKQLRTEKVSKNTWRVYTGKTKDVRVQYRVYAFELTVRTSFVDAKHAYLNGTSVFMYPEGHKTIPSELIIKPHPSWSVISTSLDMVGNDPWKRRAENYDILADSPIEIGNHEVITFEEAGIPHEIAMFGSGNYDEERLVADTRKIIRECMAIFGEHPSKRYLFIVHNLNSGGGGLEHLNSTTLQTSRWSYGTEAGYSGFMSLVAHEYFHLWNVKRLRPQPLGPFNYDAENYTTLLWVSEGFTSYYDDLLTRRAGIYSPERYLEILSSSISNVENTPGNKIQTVAESSFDAWIKFYRRNENTNNAEVSYYTKGGVLALLIDLDIRKHTQGKKNLDDVLRNMYERYYKKLDRGFTEQELKEALEKTTGKSFDDFFRKYVHGTETPDYNAYFETVGLKVGMYETAPEDASFGMNVSSAGGKVLVTSVQRGGSAWNGGLSVNDEILAMNGLRVTEDPARLIGGLKKGDKVNLLINRDGLVQQLELELQPSGYVRYRVEKLPNPSEQQQKNFNNWLKLN